MTRKDYVRIARALKDVRNSLAIAHISLNNREVAQAAVDSVTRRIASELADDNAAFNWARFRDAAGTPPLTE